MHTRFENGVRLSHGRARNGKWPRQRCRNAGGGVQAACAAAAGLGDGDRPVRSPTAAAPSEKHGALRLPPPPPPPTTDNNLIKEDQSLRVLVLQPDDGSKISGEADLEDYMTKLRAQVEVIAKNNNFDSWEAEAQKTEKDFDVRNAVHGKNTGILIEFNSQKMAYEIFLHALRSECAYPGLQAQGAPRARVHGARA